MKSLFSQLFDLTFCLFASRRNNLSEVVMNAKSAVCGILATVILFLRDSGTPLLACCVELPPDFISELEQQAIKTRGRQHDQESDRAYHLRLNQTFVSLLAEQPSETLAGLQAESDDQLCEQGCGAPENVNVRLAIEAAISLKSARESSVWNWKIFLVAAISALIAFVGTIAALATLFRRDDEKSNVFLLPIKARIRDFLVGAETRLAKPDRHSPFSPKGHVHIARPLRKNKRP
jgi:hypothetical protein